MRTSTTVPSQTERTAAVLGDWHLRQRPARLHILLPGRVAGGTTGEPKPRPRAEGTGWQRLILFAFVWGI